MYSIVENVIKQGGYSLSEILGKIDALWLRGSLTDEQRNSLITLAREGAETENSIDVLAKLNDLETRLRALESISGEDTSEEYPCYEEGKWYYSGDKCSLEGINYVCIAPDGVVCVWSPTDYPTYWEQVN